ncbi:glutamyl-tRNA synthetase [Saprolegnia diclina VS20]|uniref:glutamate--tRNA ligase n=1 Tax=Saprolegnia diclina (strain VS20) TaxID=1156394 RepID=T0PMA0_SAPDV|nr:glutamyl-tRNA synthetase [Saprolegnia diclina VS20]EQC26494.1 glutamyl-tRNA synthetase [Saprolegnia diclina VS20]|eukprot:XP_008620073.1 glutamyl-tRNA synthetase [Saprolegnia diclina VS20]
MLRAALTRRWTAPRPALQAAGARAFCAPPSSTTATTPRVRVRYAPSPTGYLHLGGLRTALFNYLFAKASGGDFLMRIEDTDQTRKVEGSVEALTKSLHWCGVHEDEGPTAGGPHGPYVQSERLHIYKAHAEQLIHDGHAYRCFCSQERLKSLREAATRAGSGTMYDRACLGLTPAQVEAKLAAGEPHTVRLKVPEGKTTLKDMVRGYVQFDHAVIDDQVLMKSDGFPTYHLANVIDDYMMRITHVIRGEEWLSSTPKHVLLYKALGYPVPQFAHLGLLLNEDRSKLSKRQGDVAVEDFEKKGFLAPGLVNFVALLGWNPAEGSTKEIFTMEELQAHFSMEHINKSGSVVNLERLRWINSRHIRSLFESETRADVVAMLRPYLSSLPSLERYETDYIYGALSLMKERVSALPEFAPLVHYFFAAPDLSADESVAMRVKYFKDDTDDVVRAVRAQLSALEAFDAKSIMDLIKAAAKERKLGVKAVLMPLRYYLTGMEVGASLGETIEHLGKAETLARLANV